MAPGNAPYAALFQDAGCTLVHSASGRHPAALLARDRLRTKSIDILFLEGLRTPASIFLSAYGLPARIVVKLCYLESNHRLGMLNRSLCRSGKVARVLSDVDPGDAGDPLTVRWLGHKTMRLADGHDREWYPSTFDLTTLGIPAGAFSVAAVTDGSDQGMEWLLRGARELPMDLPIHFLLVAPEPMHARLRRLIRKIPFTQRFHLCDSVDAAPGLLACCSVLVVTDWAPEIQRRTCMQCLVSGVPVVAQDVTLINQVVRPGINGELLPCGDTQALAHVLFELYEDKERLTHLGTSARRLAEKIPSIDDVVAETVATFERILAANPERK